MTTQTADTDGGDSPRRDGIGSNPEPANGFGGRTAPRFVPAAGGHPVRRLRGGRTGQSFPGRLGRCTASTGAE